MESITLKATISTGKYGSYVTNTFARIDVHASHNGSFRSKKILTIAVDTSASMDGDPINYAKGALRAIGDFINEQQNYDWVVRIVTFNSNAELVYPSSKSYEEVVDSIEAIGTTNFERAFNVIFDIDDTDTLHWIIFLTDGHATEGDILIYKDVLKVRQLERRNVVIVPVGFGRHYNIPFLTELGEYHHIESPSDIGTLFGEIMWNFKTCWAYGAYISIPEEAGRLISGKWKIGALTDKTVAHVAFEGEPKKAYLYYKPLHSTETFIETGFEITTNIERQFVVDYFNASAQRMIFKLLTVDSKHGKNYLVQAIEKKVKPWRDLDEAKDALTLIDEVVSGDKRYMENYSKLSGYSQSYICSEERYASVNKISSLSQRYASHYC